MHVQACATHMRASRHSRQGQAARQAAKPIINANRLLSIWTALTKQLPMDMPVAGCTATLLSSQS
jgi:hypothetical protein